MRDEQFRREINLKNVTLLYYILEMSQLISKLYSYKV